MTITAHASEGTHPRSAPRRSEESIKRWMTLREAAGYASCSVKTLRRRIASADLPAYTFGRELRVLQADVDHLMRRIATIP